jgi:hypothetical protein
VLEHGLPPLPGPRMPPFNEAPVGVWQSGYLGAVLFVYHDPDDRSMPYSQDIEILARSGLAGWRTGWRVASRGGSDWPVPFGDRPLDGPPVLTGFALGAKVRTSAGVWIASGIAPVGVTRGLRPPPTVRRKPPKWNLSPEPSSYLQASRSPDFMSTPYRCRT